MDETELIQTIASRLSSALSVPVRTTGFEDERPLPVVVVDDWDTDDITHHNSNLAHEEYRDFGDGTDGEKELARWHRFYFDTRVEFLIRHDDTADASELQDAVKNVVREWMISPQQFHPECNRVYATQSANPRHQFREPTETELHVSASFYCIHDIVQDDLDAITSIEEAITAN